MTRKRSNITSFEHRLESNVLLHAEREVVDSRSFGINFETSQIRWKGQSTQDLSSKLIDVAEINREGFLLWRIGSQAARPGASCSASNARSVVYPAHSTNHRRTSAKNIPGKAQSRFKINRSRMSEAFWCCGIVW